jgi:hypothetical protein
VIRRRIPCGDTVAVAKRERIDADLLHRRAQVAVLSGLARGDDVADLVAAAAPSHVPGWFTPDVALLELAVTAPDFACPAGAEPLEYEGLRGHYLPEVTFRGRVEHRNSQYAILLAWASHRSVRRIRMRGATDRSGARPSRALMAPDAGSCRSF